MNVDHIINALQMNLAHHTAHKGVNVLFGTGELFHGLFELLLGDMAVPILIKGMENN